MRAVTITPDMVQDGIRRPEKTATVFIIAAADSLFEIKERADYVCDGVGDQVEIQAAIDIAGKHILETAPAFRNGAVVTLAPGTYNCSSFIDLASASGVKGISLQGMSHGISDTHISWHDGSNCDGIIYDATNIQRRGTFALRRLTVDNRNDGDYWAIKITQSGGNQVFDLVFEDLIVLGGGNSADQSAGGMYIEADWASHFTRCSFEFSRGCGLYLKSPNGTQLTGCFFAENDNHGLYLDSCFSFSIVNTDFSGNGIESGYSGCGLKINAGDGVTIVNTRSLSNYGYGYYIKSLRTKLTNCIARSNGQGLSAGAWAAGGFIIVTSDCVLVNCEAYNHITDVNNFGFYLFNPRAKLLGCVTSGNLVGIKIESNGDDAYIDACFTNNTVDLDIHATAFGTVFARHEHYRIKTTGAHTIYYPDNGEIFLADTSGGGIFFTLPIAIPGLEYSFAITDATNNLQIGPGGTNHIWDGMVDKGAGVLISTTTANSHLRLKCIQPGRWEIADKVGTWA